MVWQLQTAKQKFSELVERALTEGPQIVTRHGREVVAVVSIDEYRRLRDDKPDFKKWLLEEGPRFEDLDQYIERDRSPGRVIDLDR